MLQNINFSRRFKTMILVGLLFIPVAAQAEPYWTFGNNTRYMALGDSLAAGYGAMPATQGYVYLIYHSGLFDTITNTLFSNAGVPGATSRHVLDHQVPQAIEAFQPTVITITVGGNDLFRIFNGENPSTVLFEFQTNLTQIFQRLRTGLPNTRIYINNLYAIPEIPGSEQIVPLFNRIVAQVAGAFGVPVADVYSAFLGKEGLLLIKRNGADQFEVHPTNVGYRVIAKAFEEVIERR